MKTSWINVSRNDAKKVKLKYEEYVFNYKRQDLTNASVSYWLNEMRTSECKNDTKTVINTAPIGFSITAEDDEHREYEFIFILNMTLDELNKLPKRPTNITENIVEGEEFFDNPYESGVGFYDINLDSIYRYIPTFWVLKEEINKFIFKAQYEDLHIWFKVDLSSLKTVNAL